MFGILASAVLAVWSIVIRTVQLIIDGLRVLYTDHDVIELVEDFRRLAPYRDITSEWKNPERSAFMDSYKKLLLANQAWVKDKLDVHPDFFTRMATHQKPEFM